MPLSNKQMEYLAIAWACFETEPKIDYEKFRQLAKLKTPHSARELMRVTKLKLKSEYGPEAGGVSARSSKTTSDTPAKLTPTTKKAPSANASDTSAKKTPTTAKKTTSTKQTATTDTTTSAKKSAGHKRSAAEATAKTEPDDNDFFEFTVLDDDSSPSKKPRAATVESVPEDLLHGESGLFADMSGAGGYF